MENETKTEDLSKIKEDMTCERVIILMADGNPGALQAVMELIKSESFGEINLLDDLGIHGADLYVLWNDKCDRDINKLKILIALTSVGIIKEERLKELSLDQCNEVKFNEMENEIFGVCTNGNKDTQDI